MSDLNAVLASSEEEKISIRRRRRRYPKRMSNASRNRKNYITPLIFIGLLLSYFSFGPRDQKQLALMHVIRKVGEHVKISPLSSCERAASWTGVFAGCALQSIRVH
ncbi:hypothetical protein ACLOJK_012788 [Asimina triloba]